MIPSIAIVHVHNPDWRWRGLRLWVPLILLYPPLLLLSPLILLVIVAACWAGRVSPWRTIATFWKILYSLGGTDVHVRSEGNQILVRIL